MKLKKKRSLAVPREEVCGTSTRGMVAGHNAATSMAVVMNWVGHVVFIGFMVSVASMAEGASTFSNSLTGFIGDSTMAATQTAVLGSGEAGFTFWSTAGLMGTADPTVTFDATGARFGSLAAGDDGRNYMRTVGSDYALVSFTAEITVERTSNDQHAIFGMGTGDLALFGVADWSTQFSSTFMTPELDKLTTFRTANDINQFADTGVINLPVMGIQRLQMSFDANARSMVYAVDTDYAGGPFSADFTSAPVDLTSIMGSGGTVDFFGPDGWPGEPSRIYFGSDDGGVFRDFSVSVIPEPTSWWGGLIGLFFFVGQRLRPVLRG